MQQMATVFLGTFFVMFVGMGSLFIEKMGAITFGGVSLAWGAIITTNIYMFGHISGAHINPALTFSLALVGQFPWRLVPVYVTAEVFGTVMASLLLKWLFSQMDAELMLTLPVGPNPASDLKVGVLEFIITFMYALTSWCCRADSRASKDLAGVAVGAVFFVNAIIAGKVTGASMNPARSIGPAIAVNNFSKIWIYLLSTLLGAILATSLFFSLLLPEKSDGVVKQDGGQKYSFSTEPLPTIVTETRHKGYTYSTSFVIHNVAARNQ
ncbi:Aquaporin NIP1-4 [Platanthera guangdongensis]|uniref:Aquaporin NIP1-4 n=1 Tax=Platanthera guangdongensis TaxID=2320717 RepID=A0ABR2LSC2_9ASPA